MNRLGMSETWRERLARNAWWIAIVIAAALTLYEATVLLSLVTLRYALINYFASAPADATIVIAGGIALQVCIDILAIVLTFGAVRPLRRRDPKGWLRLFVVLIAETATFVIITVSGIILSAASGERIRPASMSAGGVAQVLVTAVLFAVAFYLLIQVRGRFGRQQPIGKDGD